jgi:hypothetical protein
VIDALLLPAVRILFLFYCVTLLLRNTGRFLIAAFGSNSEDAHKKLRNWSANSNRGIFQVLPQSANFRF